LFGPNRSDGASCRLAPIRTRKEFAHDEEPRRPEGQSGRFHLIELLVVIIIIGILLAIAIPSYLSFRGRAEKSAAQADVRASIPGVEAYYADHNTYSALTSAVRPCSLRRVRHSERNS
jgi:Tfp pilus assembly protein PilE